MTLLAASDSRAGGTRSTLRSDRAGARQLPTCRLAGLREALSGPPGTTRPCDLARPCSNEVLERSLRHEGVDELAVERFGGPSQVADSNGAVYLALFAFRRCLASDPEALGELCRTRTKCLARIESSPPPEASTLRRL